MKNGETFLFYSRSILSRLDSECVLACTGESRYTDLSINGDILKLENPESHHNEDQKIGSKCSFRDVENCKVTFFIKSSGTEIMMIIGKKNCYKVNLLAMFLSIFGAILLIGLLILLFIAIFKRVWHARQAKKFVKINQEKDPALIGTFQGNPMYRPPETTHNPTRTMSNRSDEPIIKSTSA